ncbi:MAG: HK97 gp10 family phage protein [Staphylococcus haemolyticus]|uniref:HK97-gp10 family putative phage morphogenesis protein n=1 Tax=Staphylococcus haemolyticus TaxID=1283 RepID=UPI001F42B215|nr:HK97-gp10 family putative phage morphogenesis protein [Staphylococcus haemolyticus]MCE4964412.1 HK97 gp10 family phage protein [Staphylococcus haemolyticus]UVD90674.1 HK97 gp10 family phage protein [Staphylococcus haemolyticus]WAI20999.1 MAG: HK97 gp10 family phage protein [Staphylococcus haemolyticus]WAI22166.1 MAG: HK97 gp10 family phage protein [Staphylococcus haemolyticus]
MAKVKYGADSLVVELERYQKNVEKRAKKGIFRTTLKIYNTAVHLMPVDTGFLRQSTTIDFENGGLTGVVKIGSMYAVYVNYGTGIYATKGSRAHRIPWTYKDPNGKWHTTYGQMPQPFWEPAIDAGRKVFESYFS